MTDLRLDGPYYRCGVAEVCGLHAPGLHRPSYHTPDKLRSIKGRWRCYSCFADGFGRDVLHEWDTAMTLADYLEAPV